MPDFSEVADLRAVRKPPAPAPVVHAVALKAEELTHSDAWNAYLEKLAEWRQLSEAIRDALRLSIGGTDLVGDDLSRARLKLQWTEGFLVALQQAIDLPRSLISADQKATAATVSLDNGASTRADS